MRFTQIAGVIATGSIAANAFLLPPTIAAAEAEAMATLPTPDLFINNNIGLPCTGCDVATLDQAGNVDESALTNTIPSSLVFRISIQEQANAADRLMINDVQIYPVEPQGEGLGSVLRADQVVIKETESGTGLGSVRGTPVLGYMLSTESKRVAEPFDLVKVHFEVVQVRNKDVRIPSFNIMLMQSPTGKLMIAKVEVAEVAEPTAGQCNSALCRFKAMIASKFSKLKGCVGKPKHSDPRPNLQVGPAFGAVGTARPSGHSRPSTHAGHVHPQHKRPHHGHGHRRHGRVARFMRSLVFHVLIPILLGVALGIAASLVGMIIGHLAIFLWRVLFRRNQGSEYQKVDQAEIAEGQEDSDGLLAPPVYEEAPAYEDAVDEKQ